MIAYRSPHIASGTHSPVASHTPGMAVNMVGDMAVNVIAPNGSWVNVFDLETTFELKFEVRFRFLVEPTPSLTGDLALLVPSSTSATDPRLCMASFTSHLSPPSSRYVP
jgi:hypothetical protein